MNVQKLQEIQEHLKLFVDTETGIAWVQDSTTGTGFSAHPNIDETGSVTGMKELGYWGKDDRTVRSHGFIYNIDSLVVSHTYDEIARQNCRCGGKHE